MLLLDSEAISALAHGPDGRREVVRALLGGARRQGLPVAVSAAVLAEVVRGRPADAGVFGVVKRDRVGIRPVDRAVGVRAGQLLAAADAGSEMAVDAFVVADADLAGGAVVATVDVDDLELLAADLQHVEVVSIAAEP